MAMTAVKTWFGKPATMDAPPPPQRDAAPKNAPVIPPPGTPAWTQARLDTTDSLWGDGYGSPGGEIETLRLAKPLGLSGASNLLLLGAGAGGAAVSLATRLGVWVGGFETDPVLAAAATARIARKNLAKRAQVEIWTPDKADLQPKFYHHALGLEPLNGAQLESALASVACALKPNGHFALMELIADTPLDPADPVVASWALLEHRDPRGLPGEVPITRILGRLGFDVRTVEDNSQRHIHQTLTGWRAAVRGMGHVRPTRKIAALYEYEAELWQLRLRLFQLGRLRLVRWHAVKGV